MKTPFRKFKNRDFEFFVGSISDCCHKLELKISDAENSDILRLRKGDSVEIVGTIEKFPPGPSILKVDPRFIKLISDRPRIPFLEMLKANKNKLLDNN